MEGEIVRSSVPKASLLRDIFYFSSSTGVRFLHLVHS